MENKADVAIIGGGVIGTAILAALARYELSCVLVWLRVLWRLWRLHWCLRAVGKGTGHRRRDNESEQRRFARRV